MDDQDNNPKAVEKAIGQPFGFEYTETAQKVRRNLVAVSSAVIAIYLTGAKLKTPTLFGFELETLTDKSIDVGLLIAVAYFLVHFTWYALEMFAEWRLRLTGTRKGFRASTDVWGNSVEDLPSDPRQSTLYTWWLTQPTYLSRSQKTLDEIDLVVADIKNRLPQAGTPEYHSALDRLPHLEKLIGIYKQELQNYQNTLISQRIPISLGRFENWMKWINNSQNYRWLLVETLLPTVLAGWALWILINKLVGC